MATGTVKWFDPIKGYGFIQPSDGSRDAFVHISAVERAGLKSLREGQEVEYDLVPGREFIDGCRRRCPAGAGGPADSGDPGSDGDRIGKIELPPEMAGDRRQDRTNPLLRHHLRQADPGVGTYHHSFSTA